MGDNCMPQQEQLKDIVKPHAHDVLSGRGNFVNHHSGNENFRKLVKHHKKAYVACPKAQKAIYSKIIYDEIRAMNPPGRFLKQDPKTKLWSDIGEKKALDKTRQALREGAPELLKEMENEMANGGGSGGGPDGGGGGGDGAGQDFVAPLPNRNNHPLTSSMLGNISLGSFSLNPLNTMNLANPFTTGGANVNSSFTVPQQMGVGVNSNMYDSQGANSILAAAAQLQAQQQQQQQQQHQQPDQKPTAEWEAQLQLLKAQMQLTAQQANNMAAQAQHQQGGVNAGGMGNNQSIGMNAMLAATQQTNNNLSMGSNELTALLAMIHQSATGMNNNPGGMGNANVGANVNAYQQQLAQLAMLNRMNSMNSDSDNTLTAGTLNNQINHIGNNLRGNMTSMGTFGNAVEANHQTTSFGAIAQQQQQQQQQQQHQQQQHHHHQQQQQHFQGGYQEQTFNMSVPLKSPSDDRPMESVMESSASGGGRRRPREKGGSNLNSSFTRAQRIGLKNSFTQRRPARHMNNTELHNSLMSIESLTLDDISADFSGGAVEGVFEDSNPKAGMASSTGGGKHGNGPHDMSEVSELEFEEKA